VSERARILVIDDDESVRKVLVAALEYGEDHPNLEEMRYHCLVCNPLSDEGNISSDNRPVFAEPSTTSSGCSNTTPRTF
jgi:CheY-like chemotaxis protein